MQEVRTAQWDTFGKNFPNIYGSFCSGTFSFLYQRLLLYNIVDEFVQKLRYFSFCVSNILIIECSGRE